MIVVTRFAEMSGWFQLSILILAIVAICSVVLGFVLVPADSGMHDGRDRGALMIYVGITLFATTAVILTIVGLIVPSLSRFLR